MQGSPSSEGKGTVTLQVGHLKSYEHMGTAEVACVSGCSCEPMVFDGNIWERVSQSYFVDMRVSRSGG